MNEKITEQLEEIAQKFLGVHTLKWHAHGYKHHHNFSSEDVLKALEEAYKAGRDSIKHRG
ncbi:MAG TPA: hypothetical protein VIY47_04805 [Ignavibacteriaceae bacterium]